MRRRHFLTALAGSTTMGVSGCVTPAWRRHPFADETVDVGIDPASDTPHDLEEITRDALEYWEENGETYAGFPVRFEVVADDDPDLVVRFVDGPEECHEVENYSERVLGCAPILGPGRLSETVRAIVVASVRPVGEITTTTKHELGHVLGLGHDDDPREIMSTLPEDRIPMYALRIEIWETVLEAHEDISSATVLFDHALSTWSDGNYEGAEAAFRAARADYERAFTRIDSARERTEEFADDPRVETVDLEGLRTHLDRLLERLDLAVGFTSAMVEASLAAASNDWTVADGHVSTANDRIQEFNAVGSPELRDVAIALGLVRGFERDEPVVDVDVDEEEITG